MRTGMPSCSSDAKASASACPQSIPPSASIASRRFCRVRSRRTLGVNPSGRASIASLSAASRSAGHGGLHPVLAVARGGFVVAVGGVVAALDAVQDLAEPRDGALQHGVRLFARHHALVRQPPRQDVAHGGVVLDDVVHARLGERGLVALVVPPAAVAHQVDDEVLAEALPVRVRQPGGVDARLRVVGVHVHHRHLEALGQVARVARGAVLLRVRW
jgi:hypothetical protein